MNSDHVKTSEEKNNFKTDMAELAQILCFFAMLTIAGAMVMAIISF